MSEQATWNRINAIDVADAARRYRASGPVPHLCIDDFLEEAFASEVAAAYPAYEAAVSEGKSYSAVHETGKVQVTDVALFPEPVAALHRALASEEFRETMVEITGIPDLLSDPTLQGGGMHLMRSGARLDVHVDFNMMKGAQRFRRLNILIFLNPAWQDDWGGRFELWDPEVTRQLGEFSPRFNRCVFFATSEKSFHGVEPVKSPDDQARQSFAAYYYTEEAPEDWGGEHHTTVFRHRPGERWRALLGIPNEVKSGARRAVRRLRGFFGTKSR